MSQVVKPLSQEEFLRTIRDHLHSVIKEKRLRKKPATIRSVMGNYRNYICSGHQVVCTRRPNPIYCEVCGKEMNRL